MLSRTSPVKTYITAAEKRLAVKPLVTFWCVIAVCLLLAISRRSDILLHPQFWAEDGSIWYAGAYQQGARTILQTYAGYFAVIHRLVAEFSLLLPFRFVPLFFNLVGYVFFLVPVALINSARARSFVPSRLAAIGISVLYVGLNNVDEIYINLANIQWPLALSAFLVLFLKPGRRLCWRITDALILVAAGVSGPSVIMLLVIALYLLYRRRAAQNRQNVIVLLCVAVLQLLGLLVYSHLQRVGSQPDANVPDFLKVVVGQIFTGGLAGMKYSSHFDHSMAGLWVLFLAGAGFLAYVLWRAPLWLRALLIFSGMMLVSSIASLRPTPNINLWHALTYPGGAQRYWFVPICAWIASIVWAAFAAPARPVRAVGAALLLILILFGLPIGWRLPALPRNHFQAYAQTFKAVPPGTTVTITINPDVQMQLTKK